MIVYKVEYWYLFTYVLLDKRKKCACKALFIFYWWYWKGSRTPFHRQKTPWMGFQFLANNATRWSKDNTQIMNNEAPSVILLHSLIISNVNAVNASIWPMWCRIIITTDNRVEFPHLFFFMNYFEKRFLPPNSLHLFHLRRVLFKAVLFNVPFHRSQFSYFNIALLYAWPTTFNALLFKTFKRFFTHNP